MSAQTQAKENVTPAYLIQDFNDFGCPGCGGIYGHTPIRGNGMMQWNCADCGSGNYFVHSKADAQKIGVEGDHPVVQEHPRHGQLVDRELLTRKRKEKTTSSETKQLRKWLRLGYGTDCESHVVSEHMSKSQELSILAAHVDECPVRVSWFAQNFYDYFLGIDCAQPLHARLLYPIKNTLRPGHGSGHENAQIAPPIRYFEQTYHQGVKLEKFSCMAGNGYYAALALRYLTCASKFDGDAINTVCERGYFDGNNIKLKEIARHMNIENGSKDKYEDFRIICADESIFKKISVYRFSGSGSAVSFTLRKGHLLPQYLEESGALSVNIKDTALVSYLPGYESETSTYASKQKRLITGYIDTDCLQLDAERSERYQTYQSHKYPIHGCYQAVNMDTKKFLLSVPNLLDALLTGYYLEYVVSPVAQAYKDA